MEVESLSVVRRTGWILPWVTLLVGCQGSDPQATASMVRDSAGVRIVEIPEARIDAPAPIGVAATPRLRVGAVEGPPEATLSNPVAATPLSDGRILVVEGGALPARLLGPDGAFLRWVGGVGEGPGEFRSAAGGGVLAGDTLWIWDGALRRVSLFHPGEGFQRSFSWERPGAAQAIRSVHLRRDGTVVDLGSTLTFSALPESGDPFQEEMMVHLLDREGRDPRPVARFQGSRFVTQAFQGEGGQTMVFIRPVEGVFSASVGVAAAPDGSLWTLGGSAFQVTRHLPGEGVVERFRGERAGERVTPAVEETYWERLRGQNPAMGNEAAERLRRDTEWPAVFPVLGEMRVDGRGRLWVSEFAEHRLAPPSLWWVLEPGGDLAGRVELPPGLTLLHVGETEILGVERDELDVPFLVAYPLEEG